MSTLQQTRIGTHKPSEEVMIPLEPFVRASAANEDLMTAYPLDME